jgi:hypothetical protein
MLARSVIAADYARQGDQVAWAKSRYPENIQ